MNEYLINQAPCGFLTLSNEGFILSANHTLLQTLKYDLNQLLGEHINTILSSSARIFFQLYFMPMITANDKIEEMYLSLSPKDKEEIPVLINACHATDNGSKVIICVFIPIQKRNKYEDQILFSKKIAEDALEEKNKANTQLKQALKSLEIQQEKLMEANKQNQNYKIETKKELQLAKKIQETSLTAPIFNDQIQIESYYKASSELSGDIYGFYQINEHQYGVILLDVMGHGISSSLITMSLQSLFHRLISKGSTANIVMKELDNHLHDLFQHSEDAWHYCTAIYLLIDTKERTIEYINAGHPPAIYQDPAGKQQELHTLTPPIGAFEGIDFQSHMITYKKGGRLLLYTDGVSESLETNWLHSMLKEQLNSSLIQCKELLICKLKEKSKDEFYKKDDKCFILADLK